MEIGTEEIPAGFIPKALSDLKELVQKEFEANRIDFKGIQTLGTPRRIVLYIESVSEKQRDEEIKKIGPSKAASFDSSGKPTKAAIGFAKGQSVPVESLEVIQTEKGEYVCAIRRETGRPTLEILPHVLPGSHSFHSLSEVDEMGRGVDPVRPAHSLDPRPLWGRGHPFRNGRCPEWKYYVWSSVHAS